MRRGKGDGISLDIYLPSERGTILVVVWKAGDNQGVQKGVGSFRKVCSGVGHGFL